MLAHQVLPLLSPPRSRNACFFGTRNIDTQSVRDREATDKCIRILTKMSAGNKRKWVSVHSLSHQVLENAELIGQAKHDTFVRWIDRLGEPY